MDTVLTPILLFLIFIGTAYYVLVPFLSGKVVAVGEDTTARTTALELRKVSLYKQIREAEFEREMGLINEEDFQRTRADLLTEVAEVVRALETTASDSGTEAISTSAGDDKLVCSNCQTSLIPDARFCTQCGTEVRKTCPHCAAAVSPGDRFCVSCGRGLLN
ncbi:MAG: zinc ribbon domain-containing protein [Fidelibacterota bacterium]|nr:MAG: zinc ribbon domain-containing protein [Candidatus Neomarinimicrobiota bacterium]